VKPTQALARLADDGVRLELDEHQNLVWLRDNDSGLEAPLSDFQRELIEKNWHAFIKLVAWDEAVADRISKKMLATVWQDFPEEDAQPSMFGEKTNREILFEMCDHFHEKFNRAYFKQDMFELRKVARLYVQAGRRCRERLREACAA
jgi:hypothetical protein